MENPMPRPSIVSNGGFHRRSLSSPDVHKSSEEEECFGSLPPENNNFGIVEETTTTTTTRSSSNNKKTTTTSTTTPDGSVSFESFETQTNNINNSSLGTPKVHLNGSLLSMSNSHLMDSTNKFMDYTRKVSMSSLHSDSRRNLLFQNVGRTLQRTHSHLKRTRLLHAFYLFALPIYTLIGAFLFQALDGDYDDLLKIEYENRCQGNRIQQMKEYEKICESSGNECYRQMEFFLNQVENCYREWHKVNGSVSHPMSDFTNAVIYAFSTYTTIGFGTISANTFGCRIATVLYGVFGIPLFFAFIKEEGNQGRYLFIWVYKKIKESRWCCQRKGLINRVKKDKKEKNTSNTIAILVESSLEANPANRALVRRFSCESFANGYYAQGTLEQRRVFIASVLVFIIYLFTISALFSFMTEWDYFTAFYFLFTSVALIGFGDVFPSEPRVILFNMIFIITGVVLFSMCYFILQEEIREKAFEASRKARMSISKYSQSLLNTKTAWSRRNSPAFDNRSPVSEASTFERLKKRRQSAPAVTLNDSKTLLSFSR